MVNKREEIIKSVANALKASLPEVRVVNSNEEGIIVTYKGEPYGIKVTRCHWGRMERAIAISKID